MRLHVEPGDRHRHLTSETAGGAAVALTPLTALLSQVQSTRLHHTGAVDVSALAEQ